MKPVPPHHLLSAYLDGELSPEEREEVERLLEKSPEARQELQELEHVGELLRQLPRNALPKSFAGSVLDACLSDTGQFQTETLAEIPLAARGPKSADSPRRSRWWRSVAGLSIAAAAVALVVTLMLPTPTENTRTDVATKSPTPAEAEEGAAISESGEPLETRTMPMASADEGTAEAFNQADIPNDGPRAKRNTAVPQAMVAPAQSLATRTPEREEDRKNLPLDDALESSEQVAVVRLVVADRQKGLRSLQQLLQQHNIPPIVAPEPLPDERKPGENAGDESHMLAVYVETNEDQLTKALEALKHEMAFQDVKQDAPIAVAQLNPLLTGERKSLELGRRNRGMGGFGSAGSAAPERPAPGIRAAQANAPRPGGVAAPAAKDEVDLQSQEEAKKAEPPKPDAEPAAEEKTDAKPKATRRVEIASTPPLEKFRSGLPQPNKLAAEGQSNLQERLTARAFSRQRQVTMPKAVLDKLQNEIVRDLAAKQGPADRQKSQAAASAKRVQVLFVLVDQASNPTPQPAANPNPVNGVK